MKKTTQAAHLIQDLQKQQRPGQVVLTPCPHCGTSMPRTELTAHIVNCARKYELTIDSPESGGTRDHDGMIDA
jgi:hypothetical protein